jgi:hypothetical protein
MQLIVSSTCYYNDIALFVIVHRVLIPGKRRYTTCLRPCIRSRNYSIYINVEGQYNKSILCLRSSILSSEKVDSFLLYIVFSFTPVGFFCNSLVCHSSWISFIRGLLKARRIENHAAFHVRQIWHQSFIFNFNVPMLKVR